MAQRFFISHSSVDKPMAIDLRDRLQGHAWVDLFEIDAGDIILEQISRGIEGASDFVLLWSKHSAQSHWVQFEFHMAFALWIENRSISLRIVCLDDESLPLYLRPFLQVRSSDPEAIATAVTSGPPRPPEQRQFFNRNTEIDAVERTLYSATDDILWFWGVPGIGKRSMVHAAAERISPTGRRFFTVVLDEGTGPVEFNLKLSAAMAAGISMERDNLDETGEDNFSLISSLARGHGVLVLVDAQRWLEEDGRPNEEFNLVVRSLTAAGGPAADILAVVVSTRRPRLSSELASRTKIVNVSGLTPEYGAALLAARGVTAARPQLEAASKQLHGHPLALELASHDFDMAARSWESARVRMASELIGSLPITDISRAILEVIAIVDGPLTGQDIAEHLSIDSQVLQAAVEECSSYGLVQEGAQPYLQIHPLVRDFSVRSFRRRSDSDDRISNLADRSKRVLDGTDVGTPVHIASLLATFRLLGLAGRIREAIDLRSDLSGVLFATATQLYNDRKYELAVNYFDEILGSNYRYLEAQLYKARCLAHLGDLRAARDLADELLREHTDDSRVLRVRGRVEFIARDWAAAARYYERALSHGRRYPPLLRDLAQARMRADDWAGARVAIESSLDQANDNPFGLNIYSQVLEHYGELPEARTYIERAIRLDPTNASFRHRLGRISEQEGDRWTAFGHYREALQLDPDYGESLVSMASVAVDLGDLTTANGALATLRRGRSNVRKPVVHNITAKVLLANGRVEEARAEITAALKLSQEPVSLGLAARIELAAVAAGIVQRDAGLRRVQDWIKELRAAGRANEADSLAVLAEGDHNK